MPFMEAQLTEKQAWYEVDTDAGTEYIPADLIFRANAREDLSTYCEGGHIYSYKRIRGYGVRLSAPGYMDCTSWEVYTSLKDAQRRYNEMKRENDGEDI